jgi:hypothetical protein
MRLRDPHLEGLYLPPHAINSPMRILVEVFFEFDQLISPENVKL